jgi:hypothetical protein
LVPHIGCLQEGTMVELPIADLLVVFTLDGSAGEYPIGMLKVTVAKLLSHPLLRM